MRRAGHLPVFREFRLLNALQSIFWSDGYKDGGVTYGSLLFGFLRGRQGQPIGD